MMTEAAGHPDASGSGLAKPFLECITYLSFGTPQSGENLQQKIPAARHHTLKVRRLHFDVHEYPNSTASFSADSL